MKHTSGPWTHERDGLILAKDGTTPALAIVYPNLSETNANARLIATAPELLETLQKALPLLVMYCNDRYNSQEENLILSKDAKEDARLITEIEILIKRAKGE